VITKEMANTAMIDPKLYLSVQKAYKEEKDQNPVFALLDEMEELKGKKVTDMNAGRYLSRLKFFLGGDERETREGPLFKILGIHFGYALAHGSRGGEWDAKMIHKLVNFSKNIRAIFESIVG
jgi:hypothetical protein